MTVSVRVYVFCRVALPSIGETSLRHHIRFREALSRPRARIHALLPIVVKLFRLSVPTKTYLYTKERTYTIKWDFEVGMCKHLAHERDTLARIRGANLYTGALVTNARERSLVCT